MKNPDGAFNEDIYLCEKFLDIKKKHKINTVIETGTYHGVTTKWFSKNFDAVLTVECNEEYYNEAQKSLGLLNNVISELKNSPKFLEEKLSYINAESTIIFLDAHWYTNPVLAELDAIKNSGKKPILAIHDFMVPNHPEFGYDVYPDQGIIYNWEWIEYKINGIYNEGGYTKEYNEKATGAMRGCLFIYPNNK
jgi:hypothetical protein